MTRLRLAREPIEVGGARGLTDAVRKLLATLPAEDNRACRPGVVLYLAGNDGVGKTTQAELLVSEIRRHGLECRYVWLRFPHLVSIPVLVLSRMLGVTRYYQEMGHTYGRWHFERAPRLASALLWCQVVDAAVYRAIRIEPILRRGRIVVLDRFVYDIMVDIASAAEDPALLSGVPAGLLHWLLPRESRTVLLHCAPEVIRLRRPAAAPDPLLDTRSEMYLEIARHWDVPVVDAGGPVEAVHTCVAQTLAGA